MLQQPFQPGDPQASVRKTFFVSARRPSGVLSLVQCADGTIAIHLDGRPYGGKRWRLSDVEAGVDAYLSLNAELKREHEEDHVPPDEPPGVRLPATRKDATHQDAA